MRTTVTPGGRLAPFLGRWEAIAALGAKIADLCPHQTRDRSSLLVRSAGSDRVKALAVSQLRPTDAPRNEASPAWKILSTNDGAADVRTSRSWIRSRCG